MRCIEKQELIKIYSEGKTLRELALYFNCSANTIRRRLLKLGLKTQIAKQNDKIKKVSYEWLKRKYVDEKKSTREIAKLIGCSKHPVLDRIKEMGLTRDLSTATKIRMSIPENRKKISGSNHYNWQKGKTKLNFAIRNSYEYKKWRERCLTRDDYTCQFCAKRGGYLHVDHIKPFAKIIRENNINSLAFAKKCKELWNINNGRVLCKSCHKRTETYATKKFNNKKN